MARLRIAHLSDPHLGPLPRPSAGALMSKRIFGYLNWVKNRGTSLTTDRLDALLDDMRAQKPDHICVTGDLINIALPQEFDTGARFLASLGAPSDVTAVPGNHDAYVPGAAARAAAAWAANMCGDDGTQRFPFVRRRGEVVLIGVSSAVATPPLSARGRVGGSQRAALTALLDKLDDAFKVVLIHHPPDRTLTPARRALADASAVRAVLGEGCVDLVLHGHNHEPSEASLPTARGSAPVIGVPSASSDGRKHAPAGYALIDIEPGVRRMRLTRRSFVDDNTIARTAQMDL